MNNKVYLKNYRPPSFTITTTELQFELFENHVKVSASLRMQRVDAGTADLLLDAIQLQIEAVAIDKKPVSEAAEGYQYDGKQLTLFGVPDNFVLNTEVIIYPNKNSSLMGMYESNGKLFTQCEAEGFSKITPYLDRPDVMSQFSTRIIASKNRFPVLLSNGNLIEEGEGTDGLHYRVWHDPFPKPCYLFALVAGQLSHVKDNFVTCSGRNIDLRFYVEEKDLDKCDHALVSLKKAMRWDEETYGREYDLDIFMIVAVDDFNMGAMENKGLNIFNTAAVLANPEITTDGRFNWIEGVVAHEYFHNWSGNRVTCRDWFQLSLKEGFTVFRDSQFSACMQSPIVKRIKGVILLREEQFAEDAGPLNHPVQPYSYSEINNFYTLTVYEKGAELVRMLYHFLGKELFRKSTDLYFDRYDGQAVTIEEFIDCIASHSKIDLQQFMLWYRQAGTPELSVKQEYNPENKLFKLHFSQYCRPTKECQDKKPFIIPVRLALWSQEGEKLPLQSPQFKLNGEQDEALVSITKQQQTIEFFNVNSSPIPSILRDFSAPVKLHTDLSKEQLLRLMSIDDNSFSRWDASQILALRWLQSLQKQSLNGSPLTADEAYIAILKELLSNQDLDKALISLILTLPSEHYLADISELIEIDAIHQASNFALNHIATQCADQFRSNYFNNVSQQPYRPDSSQIGQRSLKNCCLKYWVLSGDAEALEASWKQFRQADNMTDQAQALSILVEAKGADTEATTQAHYADQALARFYNQWEHENLAINQWFHIQAKAPGSNRLAKVKQLLKHPAFNNNPNKVRALIGGFGNNLVPFHDPSGAGYEFLVEQVIKLDKLNPQIAALMINPFMRWKKFPQNQSKLMQNHLLQIEKMESLSPDLSEKVMTMLYE